MKLHIRVLENNKEIENKILKALLSEVSSTFSKISGPLIQKIKSITTAAIISSPEYLSLVSGQLKFELGVPDAPRRIQSVLNTWFSNIQISINQPKIKGSSITGSLSISLIKSNLSDIISSDIAVITDANSGSSVNWLEWLSLAGDKTIIKGYEIKLGPNRRSRTGNAIMKVAADKKWKVPSSFSGTATNNWITRAIDNASSSIETEILQSIKSTL